MCASIFWGASTGLAYLYLGYPALVWAWSRLRPRPPATSPREPSMTVLVIAHDEAHHVARRLDNLLALDYPRDRLEIILASDGSTDATVDVACA
jgi:cellulose synthase/poly-beta-1,6-N-acetylglucosamine synthase-like glycosyltransferase